MITQFLLPQLAFAATELISTQANTFDYWLGALEGYTSLIKTRLVLKEYCERGPVWHKEPKLEN